MKIKPDSLKIINGELHAEPLDEPESIRWAKEKAAFARGEVIQFHRIGSPDDWRDATSPTWHYDFEWRVKPIDPYAELKQAHAEGKVIQVFDVGEWFDDIYFKWNYPPDRYRVKPAPVLVPLGPDDVTPGSAIRDSRIKEDKCWILVISTGEDCVFTMQETHYFDELKADGWEISRDNGKTWSRCEKEAK